MSTWVSTTFKHAVLGCDNKQHPESAVHAQPAPGPDEPSELTCNPFVPPARALWMLWTPELAVVDRPAGSGRATSERKP